MKRVVMTGHKGGIGSAIFRAFELHSEYTVAGFDLPEFDLSTPITIEHIAKGIMAVDVIVNCAGVSLRVGAYDDLDYLADTFKVNVFAPYYLCGLLQPKMTEGGSIINITSLAAHAGFKNNPAYVASKGALSALTKAMANDWADLGIRVNNVVPGYIRTPMTEKSFQDGELRRRRMDRTLLNRWGRPDDIVGAVMFLASDDSIYITGTDIIVDGGWLAKGL